MPCYDSRDHDYRNHDKKKVINVKDSNDLEKENIRLKARIAELEKEALIKEVAVCAIMSNVVKFLNKFDLLAKYNSFEKIEKVKPSLVKYHSAHREEDKVFYISFLTKLLDIETDPKTKKKIEKEIKKASKINSASLKSLTNRKVFSSEFLEAAEPKSVKKIVKDKKC